MKWIVSALVILGTLGFTAAQAANTPDPVAVIIADHPATATGQSATQLPDGDWLLLGGQGGRGMSKAGTIVNAQGKQIKNLGAVLHIARSGHTATLLPDGSVLVIGGQDKHGSPVADVERYDPATGKSVDLGSLGLLARSGHTATLPQDGTLLIAGGVGENGQPIADAELLNTDTYAVTRLISKLNTSRTRLLATLLPNDNVLLWGGVSADNHPISEGEVYDGVAKTFTKLNSDDALAQVQVLNGTTAPGIIASVPAAHDAAFPVNGRLVVRFSKRMDVTTLNSTTVTLIGPSGAVAVKVVGAEEGILLFITPQQDLMPGTDYTLFIDGATDKRGQALPFSAIGFSTESLSGTDSATGSTGSSSGRAPGVGSTSTTPVVTGSPDSGSMTNSNPESSEQTPGQSANHAGTQGDRSTLRESENDPEDWIPDRNHFHGFWMTGRKRSKLQDLAALQARAGVTAVSGQVLTLNGLPLPNVTLTIGNRSVRTDRTGRFILRKVPSGKQTMSIDATTADHGTAHYGFYQVLVPVQAGKTNVLPYTIWMTLLDGTGNVTVPSPTTAETVLTSPNIPGLELHIPAGTVIKGRDGKIVTQLNITPIPVDRPPFPLPHFGVPTYFTIQPGGAVLLSTNGQTEQGARLIYPNFSNQAPGTRMTFWNYDAHEKGWYQYGMGTVSPDGKQVIPDPGVAIYEFTGAMVSLASNGPSEGPPPCHSGQASGPKGKAGDPVDCATGLFQNEETDLVVNDTIPLVLTRSYRPQDNTVRAFGIGTNMSFDYFLVGDSSRSLSTTGVAYTYQDLIQPDGSRVHFQFTQSFFENFAWLFTNTNTPGEFYGATIYADFYPYSTPNLVRAQCGGAWTLTKQDGTQIVFPDSDGANLWAVATPLCMIDRHGNKVTFTRDTNGNLTKVTSPHGRYIQFVYDGANRVIQATDNLGRTVSYTYDAGGRLATVTDPAGNVESYTYDINNNMLSVVDKNGRTKVRNQYDNNGRVAKQTYADGTTNSFTYYLQDNAIIETIKSICQGGAASSFQTGTLGEYPLPCVYGPGGQVYQTDVTDAKGVVKRLQFNSSGYVTSVTQALGTPQAQTYTYTRDPLSSLVTSITDPLGRVTNYTYDSIGNLLSKTENAGTAIAATRSYTYTTLAAAPAFSYNPTYSRLTSVTDPLGHATTITRDAAGNSTQITDANGNAVSRIFNSTGLPISITDALSNLTQFNYNGGDLAQVIDPLSYTTTYGTDALGRTTSVTDPLGNRSGISYDLLDRVVTVTNPLDQPANTRYDPNGNVDTVVDAKGHTHAFGYDGRNYLLAYTDPLGQIETLTYDANHNVATRTDRKGQVTRYGYDSLNRLTSVTYADGSTQTYSYDAGNRLTQIVDSLNGTVSYSYDDFDRVTQVTSATGTVNYTYYANGLRQSMTVSGQPTLTYSYDAGDRLTSIVQAAASVNGNVAQTISFAYDAANRRTITTLANGVTEHYSYDADNRLTGITYLQADGSTVIGTLTYAYDADGNRTVMGGTLAAANALATATTATSYDANNRLTSWGQLALTYDADGNLTSDGTYTYTWNARNQLTQIIDTATAAVVASFSYDPLGRRQSKNTGGAVSQYLYDGANIVQALDGSGSFVANYLSGSIDEWFARQSATGTDSYLSDALGSTLMILDGTGTQLVKYTYDAYGKTTASTAYPNPFQYTGRENDGDGLYYYRARYYSPDYQRFITSDPIGLDGGINTYAYVENNPNKFNDPYGEAPNSANKPEADPSLPDAECGTGLEFCSCYASNIKQQCLSRSPLLYGSCMETARQWENACVGSFAHCNVLHKDKNGLPECKPSPHSSINLNNLNYCKL